MQKKKNMDNFKQEACEKKRPVNVSSSWVQTKTGRDAGFVIAAEYESFCPPCEDTFSNYCLPYV